MNIQRKLVTVMIAASLLGLTACDKIKKVADKVQTETSKAVDSAGSTEEATSTKINAYVELSNKLQNYFHKNNSAQEKWRTEDLAKAKAGDFKAINTNADDMERAQKKFEEIIIMPGTVVGVDDAAKAYLEVIKEYLPNWKELEVYNKAKKYTDDNGAKGKELLVKYNEGQAKLLIAQENFEKVFTVTLAQEKVKRIAEFKAKGQLLELYSNQAMEKASQILGTFNSTADFKNQTKINQANALLAELDTELNEMDKEYQIQKAAKKLDSFNRWEQVHSKLVSFTGKYREARKDPKRYNDMVSDYNDAIEDYNHMMK